MHEIAIKNLKSIYSYKIIMLLQQNTDRAISISSATKELKTNRINANRGITELKRYDLIEQVARNRAEKLYQLKC
jgi:hypothetical protein